MLVDYHRLSGVRHCFRFSCSSIITDFQAYSVVSAFFHARRLIPAFGVQRLFWGERIEMPKQEASGGKQKRCIFCRKTWHASDASRFFCPWSYFQVNNSSFWKSLGEGLRYHTGTAALGSLIIAIIKVCGWVGGWVGGRPSLLWHLASPVAVVGRVAIPSKKQSIKQRLTRVMIRTQKKESRSRVRNGRKTVLPGDIYIS